MSTPPLVTVCIPVYNAERYLGAAIESVLQQTLDDFELVILDNCSRDRSLEIATSYTDSRIRLVRQPYNLGAIGNWNCALEETRGKYTKILCADDLLQPSCLQRQVQILESYAQACLVSCGRWIIDENGRHLMSRRYPGIEGIKSGSLIIKQCVRWGTNFLGDPAAVLFRTDHASELGGFNDSQPYCLDVDFWFKILRKGDAYIQKEILSSFRISNSSWSVHIGLSQAAQFAAFIDRISNDRQTSISSIDRRLGKIMTSVNCKLRQLVYRRARHNSYLFSRKN